MQLQHAFLRMTLLAAFLVAALSLGSIPAGWAQGGPSDSAPRPQVTDGGDYRLQAEDVLHLQVLNPGFEYLSSDLVVQPDGWVKLPVKPPARIHAAGMTLTEFEDAAQRAFAGFIRYPALVVTVKSTAIPMVYVLGAVQKPASYPIEGRLRALDAIALAGGAAGGDLSEVVITHGRATWKLDLETALNSGAQKDNVELHANDVVYVPEMRKHVTVQGQVAAPKNLEYKTGMGLLEAIAGAGGAAETGDRTRVLVARQDGTQLVVDLQRIMDGDGKGNVILQPGDVITVPESRHVLVEGEVATPANLQFRRGLTLSQALAAAGGPKDRANLSEVRIARENNPELVVDLQKVMDDGGKDNTLLEPGDVITVPEAVHVLVEGQVATPLNLQFRPKLTLRQAIAAAGGPRDRANLSQVRIARQDGSRLTVDLQKSLQDGGEDTTILKPGDVITVPEQLDVTVEGYVATPRNILFKPGMTLSEAVAGAGGATENADLTQVRIASRDGGQHTIDLYTLMSQGVKDPNTLKPGDTVTVPEQLEHIIIQGEINHPQAIPYRPNLSLDAVLALSGGQTPKADLSHVKLARITPTGIQVQTVDLLKAQQAGTATAITLQPGDMITVPEQTGQVFVLGAVTRPGPVQYHPGMRLLEALSGSNPSTGVVGAAQGAGGTADNADLYNAVLTRADGQSVNVDLDKLIRQGDMTQNVVLAPNDSLYVPESKQLVYVFGAVARPGGYVLRDKDRDSVLDALNAAGGPTPNADIARARIAQAGTGGKVEMTQVRLDRVMRDGDMKYNMKLRPHDLLYVPERGAKEISLGQVIPTLLYTLLPFIPH